MKVHYFLILCFLGLSLTACDDDDDGNSFKLGDEPTTVKGLTFVENEDTPLDRIYNDVRDDLRAAGPISIVAEVNHTINAGNVGEALRPTRVILFGNPALGTPLMMENMAAGLDLPQKIVFYQVEDEDVIVAYNSPRYLASRHGLNEDSEQLDMIGDALETFVENNTGESIKRSRDQEVDRNEGIVTVTSDDSVEEVFNRLRGAIESNSNLSVVATLDHSANAATVGMTLPDSRLIVFGNPRLGTPLMQTTQTIAIDLPQKMLVYDNGTNTSIIYNDPVYLARRHDMNTSLMEFGMIATALANLADTAAGD